MRLFLRQGLGQRLYRFRMAYRIHEFPGRLQPQAVPLLLMTSNAEQNDRSAAWVTGGDQTSKVRKAGSALDHELQRAGRTYRLDESNMDHSSHIRKDE